jgi:hypothetical protein
MRYPARGAVMLSVTGFQDNSADSAKAVIVKPVGVVGGEREAITSAEALGVNATEDKVVASAIAMVTNLLAILLFAFTFPPFW